MPDAIELDHVSKNYGSVRALDELSLAVPTGMVFGLLGPNGAGKTTTMRICSTLLKPDSGRVLFDGIPGEKAAASAGRSLALMPQGKALDPTLSVIDNLNYYCRLIGLKTAERMASVERVVEQFGLGEFARKHIFAVSGGQFRRAQLARTFLGQPRRILLDEPTLGIDIQGKMTIWRTIREFAANNGCTVFLASNDIAEVETMCDEVAFIDHGKLLYRGNARNLAEDNRIYLECVLVQPFEPTEYVIPKSVKVSGSGTRNITIECTEYSDDVINFLGVLARKFGLKSLAERRVSLVDLFERYGRNKP